MHGIMKETNDQDEKESPLNKDKSDDTLQINRGVELLLRNKRRKTEPSKTFHTKFGKVISLFRREIRLHLDFSLDIKKKESQGRESC